MNDSGKNKFKFIHAKILDSSDSRFGKSLWLFNDKMWASGLKANKWNVQEFDAPLAWFAGRDPSWSEKEIDHYDYCYAVIIQKSFGWF